MLAFAAYLTLASVILGAVARVHVLLAVLGSTLLVTVAAFWIGARGLDTTYSLATIALILGVALQVGYGLGVVLRAGLNRLPSLSRVDVRRRPAQDDAPKP